MIVFIGENPGMTLVRPDGTVAVIAFWWRCSWSPVGTGESVVVWSSDDRVPSGVWSTDQALAQWLNVTLTRHFPEFETVDLTALERFDTVLGGGHDALHAEVSWTHRGGRISLRWGDVLDRRLIDVPVFEESGLSLSNVFAPVRSASVVVDGRRLPFDPTSGTNSAGLPTSSAFLAFNESWSTT